MVIEPLLAPLHEILVGAPVSNISDTLTVTSLVILQPASQSRTFTLYVVVVVGVAITVVPDVVFRPVAGDHS